MNKLVKTEECGWTTALRMKNCSSGEQTSSPDKRPSQNQPNPALRMNNACRMIKALRTLCIMRMKSIFAKTNALRILLPLRMKTAFAKTTLCGHCYLCGWRQPLRDLAFAETVQYADEVELCACVLLCAYCLLCGSTEAFRMSWYLENKYNLSR